VSADVGLLGEVVGAVGVNERGAGPADVGLRGADQRRKREAVTGSRTGGCHLEIVAVHSSQGNREIVGNQPGSAGYFQS